MGEEGQALSVILDCAPGCESCKRLKQENTMLLRQIRTMLHPRDYDAPPPAPTPCPLPELYCQDPACKTHKAEK